MRNPTLEIKLKPMEFTIVVKPVEINLGADRKGRTEKIVVVPTWHESSIVFHEG